MENYKIEKNVLTWINPELNLLCVPESVKEIAPNCMEPNSKLENIIFPSTLFMVRVGAFKHQNLKSVYFKGTCKYIQDEAFANNPNLSIIEMPTNLASVGNFAFEKCFSLEEINFKSDVLINVKAFAECKKLKKINFDKVVGISPHAFESCGFEEVAISNLDFDKYIVGDAAFKNNVNLKKVSITSPDTVLALMVFAGCSSLKELNLTGVKLISNNCFTNTGLETVYVPQTKIMETAFSGCNKLKNFTVNTDTFNLKVLNDCRNIENLFINAKVVADPGFKMDYQFKNIYASPQLEVLENLPFSGGCTIDTLNLAQSKIEFLAMKDFASAKINNLFLPHKVTLLPDGVFFNTTINNLFITSDEIKVLRNFSGNWSEINNIIITSENFVIDSENLGNLIRSGAENIYVNDYALKNVKMVLNEMMFKPSHESLWPGITGIKLKPMSELLNATGFRLENRINNMLYPYPKGEEDDR